MFNPELHGKTNGVPRKHALECLKKFAPKWRKHCRVLDLGCGDGSVTAGVLRASLPPDFGLLVGADIRPEMVAYANACYGDPRSKFIELDMAGDVPLELAASFDNVFSSFAIQWVYEQEKTFSNIHTLLVEGGSLLLLFPGYTHVYDFYRILAKQPKWFKDVERYISPYHDMPEPDKEVYRIMAYAGFKNIHVEYESKTCLYEEDDFKNTMLAIFPIKIPAELIQELMDDYMQVARELKIVEIVEGKTIVTMNYSLITAIGTK